MCSSTVRLTLALRCWTAWSPCWRSRYASVWSSSCTTVWSTPVVHQQSVPVPGSGPCPDRSWRTKGTTSNWPSRTCWSRLGLVVRCSSTANDDESSLTERATLINGTSRSSAIGRCFVSAVVSFNSTVPWAQSFIISYFGFRFTSEYILFCCLRRNVEA